MEIARSVRVSIPSPFISLGKDKKKHKNKHQVKIEGDSVQFSLAWVKMQVGAAIVAKRGLGRKSAFIASLA